MKPTLQIVGRDAVMGLPVLATAADVREVIRFLQRHPEGITAIQAMDAFRKRIFDARKVSAYEFWGIVVRSGDRLKLSPLGWDLANRLSPEVEIYRTVLNNTEPYHAGLEWIEQRNLELVTHLDIGNFWRTHYAHVLERDSEEQFEAYAASFFHICHAAEVGTLTIGRKGQPTRLHIYPRELELYLSGAGSVYTELTGPIVNASTNSPNKIAARRASSRPLRVFISHRGKTNLVTHLTEALELADLQYEAFDRAAGSACSLEQTLAVLMRCDAGVIVITEDDCSENRMGDRMVDDLVLIQIGAALIHFEHRLLFVLKKGLRLPVSVGRAPYCEVEDEITWDTAVQLVRSLKQFKLDEPV